MLVCAPKHVCALVCAPKLVYGLYVLPNLRLYAVLTQYPQKCGLTYICGYLGQQQYTRTIPAFSIQKKNLHNTCIFNRNLNFMQNKYLYHLFQYIIFL